MLWRLQNRRVAAEAHCVCHEVVPGEFRLVIDYAGVAEVDRIIVGVDEVLSCQIGCGTRSTLKDGARSKI